MVQIKEDLAPAASSSVELAVALRTWFKIGILSFGGPAAQIALMHRVVVSEKKWLDENRFLNALSFCMLLPGPEAMQLATWCGWRLNGVGGGLAAGLLFVIPGAIVVLVLSKIYAAFGEIAFVSALFFGIKAAVLVIVIEALIRVGRRAFKRRDHLPIAVISFIAIFFLALPFPLIVLTAAIYGYWIGNSAGEPEPAVGIIGNIKLRVVLARISTWLAIWIIPLALMTWFLGREHILSQLAWFFSKLAIVTFGGAYAVLAYMGQDVVVEHQWLEAGQMMDGLGLAETTPGPLILVTEFVGYLSAYRAESGAYPMLAGIAGAIVALWATFAPCFLWIFAGAPYIDWITEQPRLRGALSAITAAVVGVIANLALWFALHVFFSQVDREIAGPLVLWTPQWSTLDWRVVLLSLISAALLLWRHWNVASVLGVSGAIALAMHYSAV